jgi:hypothetical protein
MTRGPGNTTNILTKSKAMADFSSYIEYFCRLAAEHMEIKGVYMMDINEILDSNNWL